MICSTALRKPRFVWILLAASVGFNVFFAFGYWTAARKASELQSFEGRARLFTAQLNLDRHQQALFDTLLADVMQKRAQSRLARLPRVEAFLNELAKEHPDNQALLAYADRDDSQEYRQAMVLMMRDFAAFLTPPQRAKFIQAMRQRAESSK